MAAPRRSVLAVPAGDVRKMTKALASGADQVVLDLEDSVEPGAKDQARDALVAFLSDLPAPALATVTVRINAIGSAWCHRDVMAIAGMSRPCESLVVPKVEGPEDLWFVDRLLTGVEAHAGSARRMGVQALIETARGIANVRETTGSGSRLQGLVLGYADLAASLGTAVGTGTATAAWLPLQQAVLVAARAAGIQAVDGPHLTVHADASFDASHERARELGFDGKWAIHPRQVEALNRAFSPRDEEVRHARAVLGALAEAARSGAGTVALHGEMLDEAVAAAARRVLLRAGQRG